MGAVTLRNLDPDVLETLRARAREQGRSRGPSTPSEKREWTG